MNCDKCGALLDDDAVFCYKCGSFVMDEKYSFTEEVETAGKRVRNRSSFWLFFRIFAIVIIVAGGIAGVIFGYTYMEKEQVHHNKRPYRSNREVWGDSLVEIPSMSHYKKIEYNSD